jgi:hypothetical protein
LFYNELGGVQGTPISTMHNSNYALFVNVQNGSYWANENLGGGLAQSFDTLGGQQRAFTNGALFTWVLRTGLSSTSPPPLSHLVLAPGNLNFGNQVVGTQSADQSITISNTGTGAATIAGIAASGDFFATSGCPTTLAPGANCIVHVHFIPSTVDSRAGSLTVTAGANVASLIGTGTLAATLTASASSVTVGVPVALTWTSASAGANCIAQGGNSSDGWNGTMSTSGSASITEAGVGQYTYTLNCTQGLQSAAAQVSVTDTLPTVTLSASPTNLTVGQSTTLTWNSTNASSCTASSNGTGDGWAGPKATSGLAAIVESSTTGMITFILTCASGPQLAHASVQVFFGAKSSGGSGGLGLPTVAALFSLLAVGTIRRERRIRIEHT